MCDSERLKPYLEGRDHPSGNLEHSSQGVHNIKDSLLVLLRENTDTHHC